MGDDAYPHDESIEVPADSSLAEVVAGIMARPFLASIASGKATWILVTDRPLAVVAQQWKEPRYLVDASRPISSFAVEDRGVTLRFHYWMQRDPGYVYDELAAGRQPRRGDPAEPGRDIAYPVR